MKAKKFSDPYKTSGGLERAYVDFKEFKVLWFNTGSLCNLECANCYIESSPKNDRLSYLNAEDIRPFLEELCTPIETIGITGGEPFLNPSIIPILRMCLEKCPVLVLTNGHRAIKRWIRELDKLNTEFSSRLHLRISLDHFTREIHEGERGKNTFDSTLETIKLLHDKGYALSIAARLKDESYEYLIGKFQSLFSERDIGLVINEDNFIAFPEMITGEDVPEVSTRCWDKLGVSPNKMMCASQRMVVKKKNKAEAQVQACTLLGYSEEFNMGDTLEMSRKRVYLNHEFCAKFCVLSGASCCPQQ